MNRICTLILVVAAAVWSALLAGATAFGWDYINADTVAYLRIAGYYASGRLDLAVTGYWGPALSWLVGAILLLVHDPLVALRLAMGISAIVFVCGSYFVLRWFEISGTALALATALISLGTIPISVAFPTPDLLLAGLLCFGGSRLLAPSWSRTAKSQFATGLLFGLAYLTKAVALPTFLVMLPTVTTYFFFRGEECARRLARHAVVALLGFALLATPWIFTISLKYGKPVFSTSARIAHIITGPGDVDRYHPVMRSFLKPEPERLTQWEDPTNMAYRPWSPFASAAYARHQVAVIGSNLVFISAVLVVFGGAQAGIACLLKRFVLSGAETTSLPLGHYFLTGIFLLSVCLPYLAGYGEDVRYFLATFPFLLGASIYPIKSSWSGAPLGRGRFLLCASIVGLCLIVPQLLYTSVLVRRIVQRNAVGSSLRSLGQRLKQESLTGFVASNTRDALFLGLYWEQPILGVMENATADQLWTSDAAFAVVTRTSGVHQDLDADPERFELLDTQLFSSEAEADACCVMVYRVFPKRAK